MAFSSLAWGYCSYSVPHVFTEHLLYARLVLGAVLHAPVLSHHWKTQKPISSMQAFISHNLSVLGKDLPSLIKHHFFFFFFFYQKGSGERDLSPHTTQALGKDMRTLGSFHRTLDEMAIIYGDPSGQDRSG